MATVDLLAKPAWDLLKRIWSPTFGLIQDRLRTRRARRLRSPLLAQHVTRYYWQRGEEKNLFVATIGATKRVIPFLSRPEWYGKSARDQIRFVLDPIAPVEARVSWPFLAKRWLLGYRQFDDPVFMFSGVRSEGGKVVIDTRIGRYFQYITACGGVEQELLASIERPSRGTPIRDRLLASLDQVATAPLKAHAMGTHCMIFGATATGWETLIQERSSKTVTLGKWWSVCPAFAFQPLFDEPEVEHDYSHQFFREYGEELLGIKELSGRTAHVAYNWFYRGTPVEPLIHAWTDKKVTLHVLGFGFDLLNCEPNVALLACIHDPAFWQDQRFRFQKSWEADRISIVSVQDPKLEEHLSRGEFTPGSAFAISQALAWLHDPADPMGNAMSPLPGKVGVSASDALYLPKM